MLSFCIYTVGLSSQVAIYSYFCVMMHSWILMAAQYLIVRNVVCHSTGLVYVRQHLDRMLEAGASWTTFIRWRWFIFLNEVQKVRRYRGVRRVPSLCLSQYGSAERLSEYQKTVPETQYWPTCLDRLRATHCCSLQSEPGWTLLTLKISCCSNSTRSL